MTTNLGNVAGVLFGIFFIVKTVVKDFPSCFFDQTYGLFLKNA